MKTVTQHLDEPCHNCGGTYHPAPQPTDEQRALAADRTEPVPLPPHYDTAPVHVVLELGPLYVCDGCGSGMRGLTNADDDKGNGERTADAEGDQAHEARTKAARGGASRR